jgi:pyruvate formate lyase activating enzyme
MIPPIKGFIKSTLLDWEGRVASLIFLPGCNFRCPMCHSPHLVGLGEEIETIPLESVLEHVTANRGWIDGLAITGGEPTLQPGIIEMLELLRGREVPVKLDTNGSRPDVLEEILQWGLVEAIAMDIKAPPGKYDAVAGVHVDVAAIERSIRLLKGGTVEYVFRSTVCRAFHTGDDIEAMARWIRGAKRYVLQNFRPRNCLDPEMEKVEPFGVEQLQEFAERARKHVGVCVVQGYETADKPYSS